MPHPAQQRALARLKEAAPAWMPSARLDWLAERVASMRLPPSPPPRSVWRYACCHGCVAALLLPRAPDEAFAAGVALIGGEHARDPGIIDALAVAAWLLALKRMRAPRAAIDPPLAAEQARRLGLGPEGLVEAIAGLGEAVDRGRRLAHAALEHAELMRRHRR